jgi:phospholipid/cholesterol/gamma-HCH transport system ATP-binding protein
MIRVTDLSKSFDTQVVLTKINLEVRDGEILVILGQSGSGKSVLLRHMIGLHQPDSGTVQIDNDVITGMSERDLLNIRKKAGYLFQDGALYDFMNVYENVAFPLREHTDLNAAAIKEKVTNILFLIGLKGVEEKFPSELSGGMRKRVALARAIILSTKFLFCDEPTSGLDPILSRDIMNLIRDVAKKLNCTTVIASHDIPNSFRIADRLVLIQNSKIVASGNPKELQHLDNEYVQEFITNGTYS